MHKSFHIIFLLLLFVAFNSVFAQNIFTIAGNGTAGNGGDGGLATVAELQGPAGIAVDAANNIYISSFNCIRKIDATGKISTFAGSNSGAWSYTGDGGLCTAALLHMPGKLCVDKKNNIYFPDIQNNCIRRINTSGIISTIAGTGVQGFSGDGGVATSANLNYPNDLAIDTSGNIYIADGGNHRIRKINSAGIINTIAGTGLNSYSGDGGPAILADLNAPVGIEVDMPGNIFVADFGNSRIRKIDVAGKIITIIGTGVGGNTGDGGLALLAEIGGPRAIKLASQGDLYFSDYYYSVIRKVSSSGIISTVVGNGSSGYFGDGGLANLAQINNQNGITLDQYGNLYIADSGNNRIRKVDLSTGINKTTLSDNLIIYPNPVAQNLNIVVGENNFQNSKVEIINAIGQCVLKQAYSATIDVASLTAGLYTFKITNLGKQSFYSKFIKE